MQWVVEATGASSMRCYNCAGVPVSMPANTLGCKEHQKTRPTATYTKKATPAHMAESSSGFSYMHCRDTKQAHTDCHVIGLDGFAWAYALACSFLRIQSPL